MFTVEEMNLIQAMNHTCRKRFWQDWRRSSKETVWQITVTPDT